MYQHPHGHVFYRKMAHSRPKISYGEGIYLYDEHGKRYIDGSGGPFVVNVGHGRSEIVEAMRQQAQAAAYIHAEMFTSDALEQFSSELAKIVPLPEARFFFLSSGSEVVEGALKLARQIQMARGEMERSIVISRSQSYHGMTLGALSASGRPALRKPYQDMMLAGVHVDPPYPYRHPCSGEELAAQLEETIQQQGAEKIAAFIAEPISGAGLGPCIPPDDYWPAIREVCYRYGALLIADEVLVGMGRTGKWWSINHWKVEPDILVTSKGLAGGYFPLGLIAARGEDVDLIYGTLGDFNHGGTFSHHAVGAAAGLATLQIIQHENLVQNAAIIGEMLGKLLCENFRDHPYIGDIRGRGLYWGLELVQNKVTKAPFPSSRKLAQNIWQTAFDLGLSLYYSQGCADGQSGDLILLGPPLIVTESQIHEIVAILREAINQTFSE
jgi:hypothetical protein